MPSLAIVDTYQPSGQYHKDVMGSRGSSPLKLFDYLNLESEEMPFLAIIDTYQPSRSYPVSQQSGGVQER